LSAQPDLSGALSNALWCDVLFSEFRPTLHQLFEIVVDVVN